MLVQETGPSWSGLARSGGEEPLREDVSRDVTLRAVADAQDVDAGQQMMEAGIAGGDLGDAIEEGHQRFAGVRISSRILFSNYVGGVGATSIRAGCSP